MRYARVLPVPVADARMTLFPRRISGTARSWMGVGWVIMEERRREGEGEGEMRGRDFRSWDGREWKVKKSK